VIWLSCGAGDLIQLKIRSTAADSAIASSVRGVTGARLADRVCCLPQLGQMVAPIGISQEQAMQLVISSFITPPSKMTDLIR
jgi:hypothetical protein